MNENDLKIVRITNISNFDFTGDLGARYDGRDFVIVAGGSLLTPFTVGDHLATHLARAIKLKNAPIRDAKETDGKGSDRPLWDDASLLELKAKIMKEVYEEERTNPVSEADRMALRVAELNKTVPKDVEGDVDAPDLVPSTGISAYKDKAQVIAELTKREIKFNARDSKDKLEKLLENPVV